MLVHCNVKMVQWSPLINKALALADEGGRVRKSSKNTKIRPNSSKQLDFHG